MARAVLITQCLQRDFVTPLAPGEALPNALHVGRDEALRLWGPDPEEGPLARMVRWARAQADLEVVHIRDCHDAADPAQHGHLVAFGGHCLAGTPGAELVGDLSSDVDGEHFVDAVGLNDMEETRLATVLGPMLGPDVRVGVIGVWTEAKVSFLLYDLATRLGVRNLATCDALTASGSRAQHVQGLEHLRRILGVRVLDDVEGFCQWLLPGAAVPRPPAVVTGIEPDLEGSELPPEDRAVVGLLFRDARKVRLHAISGGFSGAGVYRASSWDALGHERAPGVLKLGSHELIRKERAAFERVEAILGNRAPRVLGYAALGQRAGLLQAFADMGTGSVRTFKTLYEGGAPHEQVARVLDEVFGGVLERFYAAAMREKLSLRTYYGFSPEYAEGTRKRAAAVLRGQTGSTLRFVDGSEAPNVADFYARLDRLPDDSGQQQTVSMLHGDLNGANILLDGRDNVWLIDFFHAHRGHVLKDVAKLENDLLYIFTGVSDGVALEQALAITRVLAQVRDLREPLPEAVPGVTRPKLLRAWRTLRLLRGHTARLCRDDGDPVQLAWALLRYAVHTLSFDESSDRQKEWALYSACLWAQQITREKP